MTNVWFRLFSVVGIISLLLIAVVGALPADDSGLDGLFAPPSDCPIPCFLGIRPGTSRVADALHILQSHEWIDTPRIIVSGRGQAVIRWDWSGQQPASIDPAYPGRLTFYWNPADEPTSIPDDSLVETISIQTRARVDNVQRWFGAPDAGTAARRLDHKVEYWAVYNSPESILSLSTMLPCPIDLLDYWNARATIIMSIGQVHSSFVSLPDLMKTC